MISAKVIADSISEHGRRLTTLQLVYPRFIHAEFMTHRVFSRNASSSRAIPVSKMISQVRNEPATPVHWGKNQAGMQAFAELKGADLEDAKRLWRLAAEKAADIADAMALIGLHKQVANRILEPFQYIHTIVTGTEWDNFHELRDHADAEPNIRVLAQLIGEARSNSTPKMLLPGQWHLPYFDTDIQDDGRQTYTHWITAKDCPITGTQSVDLATALKCSVARCARVSYLNHDGGVPVLEKNVRLYEDLVGARPLHASPTEHQATPDVWSDPDYIGEFRWANPELHGNFVGWKQHRKYIERGLRIT